jgi:hypothetical protein
MGNAEQILVIILSSFLAVFLLLGIIFLILAIKVIRSVKRISIKAEALTDKAEAVSEFVQHAAGPILVGKILSSLSDTVFKRKSKSKSK